MKHLLPFLAALLLVAACDNLPDDDEGSNENLNLIALLEPGDSGLQEIRLTAPQPLGAPLSYETTFVPGATIELSRENGDSWFAEEDAAAAAYVFDRGNHPLMPYEEITLSISGSHQGRAFSGSASTRIVSAESFAFTEKPDNPGQVEQADTLMLHDEEREQNFTDPTAFWLDWSDLDDAIEYGYQMELELVEPIDGGWEPVPIHALQWLREDEEEAFQWGPYPMMRTPPSVYVSRQRISWGAFVFVDSRLDWPDDPSRQMGYYEVRVRRMTPELLSWYFSSHFWIRVFDTDPLEWNLVGENLQGIVGSNTTISFRVAIVEQDQ